MTPSRIGLCLITVVLLVGLAIQNNTPTLSLVFLGMRLQPLPLGLLVVLSYSCGLATGLAIVTLLRFNRYLLRRKWTALQNKDSFSPKDSFNDRKDSSSQPQSTSERETGLPPQSQKSPWSWGKFKPEPEPEQAPWDDWEEEPGAQKTVYDADFRVIRPPAQPDQDGEIDDDSSPRPRRR
jgi:uncharacterized integral membrane protein